MQHLNDPVRPDIDGLIEPAQPLGLERDGDDAGEGAVRCRQPAPEGNDHVAVADAPERRVGDESALRIAGELPKQEEIAARLANQRRNGGRSDDSGCVGDIQRPDPGQRRVRGSEHRVPGIDRRRWAADPLAVQRKLRQRCVDGVDRAPKMFPEDQCLIVGAAPRIRDRLIVPIPQGSNPSRDEQRKHDRQRAEHACPEPTRRQGGRSRSRRWRHIRRHNGLRA
jgi:hypothetical protein